MQRIDEWRAVGAAARLGASRSATGAEIHFRRTPEVLAELRRLVAAEGECCATGDVDWELDEHDHELTVRVSLAADLSGSDEAGTIFAVLTGKSPGAPTMVELRHRRPNRGR